MPNKGKQGLDTSFTELGPHKRSILMPSGLNTRMWANKLKEYFHAYAKGWIYGGGSFCPNFEGLERGRAKPTS